MLTDVADMESENRQQAEIMEEGLSDSEDEEPRRPLCPWKEGPDIPLAHIFTQFWKLWQDLCFKLDIKSTTDNNWKLLAYELGLQDKIDWIGSPYVTKDSCTQKLFEMYRDQPNSSVKTIMHALETNGRLDALKIMEEKYPEILKYWEDWQKKPVCSCIGGQPTEHTESIGSNSPTSPVCDGSPAFTRCPQEHRCSFSSMNCASFHPLYSACSAGCCSGLYQSRQGPAKRPRLCDGFHDSHKVIQRPNSNDSQDSGCTSLNTCSMDVQCDSYERPELDERSHMRYERQKSREEPAQLERVLLRMENNGLSLNGDSISPLFPHNNIPLGATEEVQTTQTNTPPVIGKPGNQGNSALGQLLQPPNGKHKHKISPEITYTPGQKGNGGVHTIIQSNVSVGGGTVQECSNDQLSQSQEPPIKVLVYQPQTAPAKKPDASKTVTSMVQSLSLQNNTFPRSRAEQKGDQDVAKFTHRRVVSVPRDMQPQPFRQITYRGRIFITYSVNGQDAKSTKQHVADVIKLNDFLSSNQFLCRMEEYDKKMDDTARNNMNIILQEVNFIIVCVSPQYKADTEDQLDRGLDINMQVAQRTQYVYQFMRNEFYNSNCSSLRFIPVVFEQSRANHNHVPHWLRQSCPKVYKWRSDWKDLVFRLSRPAEIVERFNGQYGPRVVTVHHGNS